MSKKKKNQQSDSPSEGEVPKKNTLLIGLGILVLAFIVIAACIVWNPGTGSTPVGKSVTAGSGSGAAVVTGDQVSVYYTGSFVNGTVFDENINRTPITVKVGSGQVIPGFDEALVGMKAGQTRTVTIPVEKAYGPYHPEYVQTVNRTGSLATMTLREGMTLSSTNPSTGAVSRVRVTGVTPGTVTLDGNNPLAGEPLVFKIELLSIG